MTDKNTDGIAVVLGLILLGIVLFVGSETIALILAAVYLLGIIGLYKAMKLKGTEKIIPINLWSALFMVGFLGLGLMGIPGLADLDDARETWTPDGLTTAASGVGDIVVYPNYWNNGSDFAESGDYYLVDPNQFTDHYQALQVRIDEGSPGLKGPDGILQAQKSSVSSGSVTFSSIEVTAGQKIAVVYIDDDTPAAAEWSGMLWNDIVVSSPDDDDSDNNHKLTNSVLSIAQLGTLDSYDTENNDISQYLYKGTTTTAEANKLATFWARPQTEGTVIRDTYFYVETDSTSDNQIDHIKIAGTVYQFSSWIDISDASATYREAKESKQATGNTLYAVAVVPVMEYISSTAGTPDSKGKVEIEIQWDFPSMAVNTSMMTYVYGVCQGAGGADMHYSASANPLLTFNATTQVGASTAWT